MPTANLSAAYQLDWDISQSSQNVSANTSVIYGRLILRKTSGSGFWSNIAQPWSVTIHGQTFSGSFTYDFRQYSELWLWQGHVTVSHSSDGTLTVGSSGAAQMNSPAGNASVGRTLTLSTIPRASKATFSASPVTNTAVTIHTNRASSGFTHTITYGFGGASGTIASGVTDNTSWTPPRTLLAQIPNSATGTGNINVATYNGSTHIGTTSTGFTLTADAGAKPSLTDVTLSEASTVVTSKSIGAYVQDQSTLNYAFSGAAGINGSTIASYALNVAGTVYTAASGVTGPLAVSGTLSVTGQVTDTRGRKSDVITKTLTVLPWSAPQITSMTVERSTSTGQFDADGTFIKVTLTGVISSLMVASVQKNRLTYSTKTSPSGANTWGVKTTNGPSAVTSVSTSYVIGTYPESASFDILTSLTDVFTTIEVQRTVPVAAVALDLGEVNVGVGKFWERGTLDVGGDVYAAGEIYSRSRFVVPLGTSTLRWTKIVSLDGVNATTGAHAIIVIRGGTNTALLTRTTTDIHFIQRGSNQYKCDVKYEGERLKLKVVQVGEFAFDLWLECPANNAPMEVSGSLWQGTMGVLVQQTTVPTGTDVRSFRADRIMVPTSVTNGTFDPATGRINLAPNTKDWLVDGIFAPEFRAYRILFQWFTNANNGAGFRLRSGGVTYGGNDYNFHTIFSNTTGTSATQTGITNQGAFPAYAGYGFSGEITVTEPMYTEGTMNQKRIRSHWNHYPQGQTIGTASFGNHDTLAMDGFTLYLSSQGAGDPGTAAQAHGWLSVEGIV